MLLRQRVCTIHKHVQVVFALMVVPTPLVVSLALWQFCIIVAPRLFFLISEMSWLCFYRACPDPPFPMLGALVLGAHRDADVPGAAGGHRVVLPRHRLRCVSRSAGLDCSLAHIAHHL